jgi:hypothetical protein
LSGFQTPGSQFWGLFYSQKPGGTVVSMRDNYVGDIGDFVKYGLLRALCASSGQENVPQLTLGVIWYLFPDLEKNNDGQFLHYLKPHKKSHYHACDPLLYESLERIILEDARSVGSIQERDILPSSTAFYEAPLTFTNMPKGTPQAIQKRMDYRKQWLQQAIETVKGYDIVFVDPDNGLEIDSVKRHENQGPKFVYFDELIPFVECQQTLVIYQHKNRSATVEEQIQKRMTQLQDKLGFSREIHAIYFKTSGGRIFFILPSSFHQQAIENRLITMADSEWGKHFMYFSSTTEGLLV